MLEFTVCVSLAATDTCFGNVLGLHGSVATGGVSAGFSWVGVSLAATDTCVRLALFYSTQPSRYWRPVTPSCTLRRDSSRQAHQVSRLDAFTVPCNCAVSTAARLTQCQRPRPLRASHGETDTSPSLPHPARVTYYFMFCLDAAAAGVGALETEPPAPAAGVEAAAVGGQEAEATPGNSSVFEYVSALVPPCDVRRRASLSS